MTENLLRLHVENFKSLRDFTIDCKKFNVLIGANGSGKTNMLELFKFANLCIDPDRIPGYPFRSWSGFKNIVWSHDVNLPISLEVNYRVEKYDIEYKMTMDGSSGRPEFLDEELNISNYIHIQRNDKSVEYKLDAKFLAMIKDDLSKSRAISRRSSKISTRPWTEGTSRFVSILRTIRRLRMRPSLPHRRAMIMQRKSHFDLEALGYIHGGVGFATTYPEGADSMQIIPSIVIQDDDDNQDFIHMHATNYFAGKLPIILLRQLNFTAIREAPEVDHIPGLGEDGVGLISTLFRWYTINHGLLPERFGQALESVFPGWQISFDVTADGRILLNVHDGNVALSPPSVPDGFYKLLAILTAVEMEPKLLLIDEMDTSLHAEIIDYVLSELRTCNSHVIITTHSPLIIDAVELEDVVILERSKSGTVCKRIEDIDSMKEKLREQGLTLSESWIYS